MKSQIGRNPILECLVLASAKQVELQNLKLDEQH